MASLCLSARDVFIELRVLRVGRRAASFPYVARCGHEDREPGHNSGPRTAGVPQRARRSASGVLPRAVVLRATVHRELAQFADRQLRSEHLLSSPARIVYIVQG